LASCAVVIPALDEEATIADVVEPALAADIGPVLVVDDGSSDDTANAARSAGADVLRLPENRGKGGAVVAGARHLSVDVLVLLDADLTGLRAEHVLALAEPVRSGQVDMTRGRFTGGRWQTATAQQLAPQLNGQRGIRRDLLLSIPSLEHTKYGLEVALTEWARTADWRCRDVELAGVSQVMKEEKRGWLQGFSIRLRMYADILETMLKRNGGPR
jgi:glycosyltransferase involved in cell wall biosynthesis